MCHCHWLPCEVTHVSYDVRHVWHDITWDMYHMIGTSRHSRVTHSHTSPTRTPTHFPTRTHARTHAHTHTHTRTRMHACMHACTHARTLIDTRVQWQDAGGSTSRWASCTHTHKRANLQRQPKRTNRQENQQDNPSKFLYLRHINTVVGENWIDTKSPYRQVVTVWERLWNCVQDFGFWIDSVMCPSSTHAACIAQILTRWQTNRWIETTWRYCDTPWRCKNELTFNPGPWLHWQLSTLRALADVPGHDHCVSLRPSEERKRGCSVQRSCHGWSLAMVSDLEWFHYGDLCIHA